MTTTLQYHQSLGRRKEATATLKLFPKGTGKYTIKTAATEKTLQEYFGGNEYLYQIAIAPLTQLGVEKTFDGQLSITGGGIAGHADAIKLAFARALTEYNSEYRLTLKPHGHLKRDPRIKERKKPGLKKARKAPTWSKR